MNHKNAYGRMRQDSGHHRRILPVMLFLGVFAFAPVLARLGSLMIGQYSRYAELALRNQSRSTSISADRGVICDRNMNILACSKGVENVYLNPHELKQSKADVGKIADFFGDLLGLDPGWIEEQAQDRTKRYKQIAAKIDSETGYAIRTFINENDISGVHLEPATMRYYPYGSLAAQVIGFTNAGGEGCEGVEAAYDRYLAGKNGKTVTTKGNNEMDMPFSYENFISARPGCSVVLTIDATIQSMLEKQMAEAIARYDVQNGAFGMVMHAKTGEILAMATLGAYDPNDYQTVTDEKTQTELAVLKERYLAFPEGSDGYESGKNAYENALNAARLKQWRNRCISDGYEPGSTFKVITMASAIDCGAIDLNTNFYCRGAEQIPGRSQLLHCWRAAGHGAEQTAQALQNSCNIAFAHIALKLGGERFYDYVKAFGVLEKTGIDLAGESKGVFFDRSLIVNTEKWGTASLTSGSFGQTFKLTPLQLVRGIAAAVNGGYLLEPYVVSEIIDADGNTVLSQEPTVLRQVISEETSRTMRSLIESVVAEGTAKNAQTPGYRVGGKTGTSEKIDVFDENGQRVQDKIVSFVGIAPMDDPEYIVLVALDTPSRQTGIYISGGVMAAPTVGKVMAEMLPYLEVPQSFADGDMRGQLFTLGSYIGMTAGQAEKALGEIGLTFRRRGDGDTVTGQIPAAGESLPGGSEIILYFGETPENTMRIMPDFIGMTAEEAEIQMQKCGIYIQAAGSDSPEARVIEQSVGAGELIPAGSTVKLIFADLHAAD